MIRRGSANGEHCPARGCLYLWSCTLVSMIQRRVTAPCRIPTPNRSPAQRIRLGEEGQHNEWAFTLAWKRTMWSLPQRRCGHDRSTRLRRMPRVSCDPSGWDRGVLPRAAGPARCLSAGGEAAADGLRGYLPGAPANLKAERVSVLCVVGVLCPLVAGGWQGHTAAHN